MAYRSNYWSCSTVADKIRGIPSPKSGTSEEWDAWHKKAKANNKLRYWLADDGLDLIQDTLNFVPDKFYDLKCYLINRFVSKHHALTASPKNLKRGQWHDMDSRVVHCLFDELVNFVEVEKAHMMVAWDKKARDKYVAPWYSIGRWKSRTWRSPEAGLAYLKWEMSMKNNKDYGYNKKDKEYGKPTHQAKAAKEIYKIYTWYKNVRPNRKDPMDLSGWSEYCDEKRKTDGDSLAFLNAKQTPKEKARVKKMIKLNIKIEEQQFNEDTEMLNRLIAIRDNLWT